MQSHPSLDRTRQEGSVTEEEADLAFNSSTEEERQHSESAEGSITPPPLARDPEPLRCWRDVFWLFVFIIHLAGLGFVLFVLGADRFQKDGRLKLDKITHKYFNQNEEGRTEKYWPLYALAGGIGTVLAWAWLSLLCTRANQITKVSVHSLTTYLAVISVFCFWQNQIFWGIASAIAAVLHFLYVMSVMDRFPYTMLVLKKSVKMVWSLPEVVRVSYAFLAIMLLWMALWSFGVAGVIASSMDDGRRWWLLVVAMYGKSFNQSAWDAWELFQSTGIESLIAYDCSGAVLLMVTILGGLITGTCVGIWTWFKKSDHVIMVGSTAMLMGMILVGLTLVVVESAVTSIYICYAEDPSLINRWDEEFYSQISEALHQRLQHRSSRNRDVLSVMEIQTQISIPVPV